MAKKGNRVQVILECTEHKDSGMPGTSRYISTKNKKNSPERLELKKFNPTSKEFESGPPLTEEEIKHKSIRFYSLQLKDEKNVKIDIDKFASLGGATLASLLNRSSKFF